MSQPISRILFPRTLLLGDDHPSGYSVAGYLKRLTRTLQRAAVKRVRGTTPKGAYL